MRHVTVNEIGLGARREALARPELRVRSFSGAIRVGDARARDLTSSLSMVFELAGWPR